jgi:transposase-like protein
MSCGHPLRPSQKPHDRHRAPVFDYRCPECGRVFNTFTQTVWSGGRYTCVQMVLILRGIAQGVPTEHLADELGIDRAHLLAKRHEIQKLLEQRLSPLAFDG